MKKLVILFILILSSNSAFAQTPSESARWYIEPGQRFVGLNLDATGYLHGVEMNKPGKAWIIDSKIINAGTGFVTDDGRHGDGRGIVVSVAGAELVVINTESNNNSEDGYRAINGGKISILNSDA